MPIDIALRLMNTFTITIKNCARQRINFLKRIGAADMIKNMKYVSIRFKIIGLGGFYQWITRSPGICPSGGVGEQPRFSANGEGPDGIFGQFPLLRHMLENPLIARVFLNFI
jgi:hypothetical protein